MVRKRAMLSLMLVCFLVIPAAAQQKNKIEGVWRMVSGKLDGKEMLSSGSDMKFITAKHFIYIAQDKAKTISAIAKKTKEDPLTAYMDSFRAGSGTYKLEGNKYTETIEFSADPIYIGRSFDFTMRVEGNRLYQSGKFPLYENGKKVRDALLEEVYERVE